MSKYLDRAREVRADKEVHYNCAQGVLVAFADELGLDEDVLFRVGANFGSGMRMGSTCGAVTGALMVLGLFGVGSRPEGVEFLKRARAGHDGKLDCKDLLKANAQTGVPKNEHCDGMVYEMVELAEQYLRERGVIGSSDDPD